MVFLVVSALGEQVNWLTTRVRQSEHSCGFVKALPCRIVTGSADDLKICVAACIDDERIAAGYRKAEKRRLKLGLGYVVCRYMAFYVVHRYKRHIKAQCNGLGEV